MNFCTVNAYQYESCVGSNKCSIQGSYKFPKHCKFYCKVAFVHQT